MTAVTARRLARAIFAGSVMLALSALAVSASTTPSDLVPLGLLLLPLLIYGGVGMLMAAKHPSNPLGWLFCSVGAVIGATSFALAYAGIGSRHGLGTGTAPGADAAAWFLLIIPPATLAFSLPVLLLLFPDGRLLSRRWKAAVALAIGGSLLWMLGVVAQADQLSKLSVPHWIDAIPTAGGAVGAAAVTTIAVAIAGFVSLAIRYRRATGEARKQLQFLTMMLGVMAVVTALAPFTSWPGFVLATLIDGFGVLIGIPVATAIAVLTFGLYDVGFVVRKTVVSGFFTVGFVLLFFLVVFFGGTAVGARDPNGQGLLFIRGALVGLSIWPSRWLAVRLSQRLIFGGRVTPYEVLTKFSGGLGETYATDDVLQRVAGLLSEAVGAREAGVWLRLGETLRLEASVPEGTTETQVMAGDALPDTLPGHAFGVRDRGDLLGAITVVMPANDPMNKAKEALVRDLASQAGLVLRNVQLIEELRESRRRIVTAQDERAKKLERDIHDGAQQQLVALYAQASSIEIRLERTDGHLSFTVRDDGVGFKLASTGYGTGLQGMADRVEAIGGALQIRSSPGEGTTVSGRVPATAVLSVG